MNHKQLAFPLGVLLISALIFTFSCRKINEATSLGDDLIPPVDNIHTFDTILDVQVFNDTFTALNDSTTYGKSYEHFLGQINNDAIFGRTDAKIYLQLKPAFFRYSFQNKKDSLHIDSVVLVLDYVETYGDTTSPQQLNVYEIAQNSDFDIDSVGKYLVRNNGNIIKGGLLGSRTVIPSTLNDSVKAYQDTTVNQLRIRLDDSFGARLLAYDSAAGPNGAYYSDSAFNTKLKGFAIESTSGDALMGFNLMGGNTKLAIYYKDDHGDAGNTPTPSWDTTVAYFMFNTNANSASQQYVSRDYTGTPIAAAAGGTLPDDIAFIQATPGSYATLKIPGLAGLSNRIVHRAELIMEQLYDISDSTYRPPTLLFVDAFDPTSTASTKFRTIPYDFLFDQSGNSNIINFGALPFRKLDPFGNAIREWRFNLSRYVQHVVNDTEPAYDLRLSAPLYFYDLYRPGIAGTTSTVAFVQVNNAVGIGRIRLHGTGDGSQTGANPQRMRLRIVYSKI